MTRITTLLIGSVGVLTESSDLQRQAFNTAFAENGLSWDWSVQDYARLLRTPGGVARITAYAAETGETVDAEAIHADKVAAFERLVDEHGLTLRPGIADLLATARLNEIQIGFVTATSQRQIELIAGALKTQVSFDVFSYIGDRSRVARSKPAPDIYLDALEELSASPEHCIAIEDTPESAEAALRAGITTFLYAGAMHGDAQAPSGATPIDDPRLALALPHSAAA